MKRKTVQTKYDVPVRQAFRWASEQKFCEAELHEIFRIPAPWLTKEIIFVCTVFLSFTLWMTCERTLIFAQSTSWIAPQNLQFTLWNSRSFIFGFCRSEHGLTDFQIEFLWSVCSKYCSFITYEIMNVKWTNIVFVLRYGDETLHLWKLLLNTNDQRGSSQCLTQRNTIFVHFTFMFS